LSLLEALPEDSPFLSLDPAQRRQRLLEALKRVVLRESLVQPLLLVFEDLHWIDSETQALLLQAITELSETALYRSLTHLQAAEFLYETRLFPERAYTFKHALTHEVAYGSLLQERRRVLHARVVEALEQLHPDRVAEQVDRLAHHALRGEMWNKALVYFRQAGSKAVQHSAHREALTCFDQALTALSYLPETRTTMEQAIDLRFERRPAFVSLGEFEPLLDDMRAAENLAKALDDQHRLGWVSSFMAHYYFRTGDSSRAVATGQRTLGIARSWEDMPLQVTTNGILSMAYWSLGDYAQAIDLAKQLRLATEGDLRYERFGLNSLASVLSRVHLAWCLGEQGAFAEGITYGEEGLRIAEGADHPDSFVRIAQGIGHLYSMGMAFWLPQAEAILAQVIDD
jgi:tetratricopeptide (TPR) repeat protein